MHCAVDYQIFQRDENGFADVPFSGVLPEKYDESCVIRARASREDDHLIIVPWTDCDRAGRTWHCVLHLPQGALYRLEARVFSPDLPAEPGIKLIYHVGVGDLFLLTGQSNMSGYGRESAYDPPQLGVHLYANDGNWKLATHPLNDSIHTIYPENCELSCETSPALAFGRTLQRRLNIPVGLVQASLGGSPLTLWHPEEDGMLYRAMLRRLDAVGKVHGVLWYQESSDIGDNLVGKYLERFTRMVALWRDVLGNVPFVTVQKNRWIHTGDEKNDRIWGLLREAQRMAARTIPDVYLVSSTDQPVNDGCHNTSSANVAIGERMAHVLLAKHYRLPGLVAPDVQNVFYVDDRHARVTFYDHNAAHPMNASGDGLNIEDDDGIIDCERADEIGDEILLTTARPYQLPARFHAYWRCQPPEHVARGQYGLPMFSCYGAPIVKL